MVYVRILDCIVSVYVFVLLWHEFGIGMDDDKRVARCCKCYSCPLHELRFNPCTNASVEMFLFYSLHSWDFIGIRDCHTMAAFSSENYRL